MIHYWTNLDGTFPQVSQTSPHLYSLTPNSVAEVIEPKYFLKSLTFPDSIFVQFHSKLFMYLWGATPHHVTVSHIFSSRSTSSQSRTNTNKLNYSVESSNKPRPFEKESWLSSPILFTQHSNPPKLPYTDYSQLHLNTTYINVHLPNKTLSISIEDYLFSITPLGLHI